MVANIVVFLLCTIMAGYSLRRIISGRYSYLHICSLFFYVMHVVSLFVNLFTNIAELRIDRQYIGFAMQSDTVIFIYNVFCVVTMFLLCRIGDHYSRFRMVIDFSLFERNHNTWAWILLIPMYMPLFGVIFAPNPEIYKFFAFFFTHTSSASSIVSTYHREVMTQCNLISLMAILMCYAIKGKQDKLDVFIVLAIIMVTWLDGKRTLFTFMLMLILTIDFIKATRRSQIIRITKKSVLFFLIIVGYFSVYREVTDKSMETSISDLYNGYYSREGEVKLAIFSRVEGEKMVEYDGQSLLFDLFFFIPRVFWEDKPVGFFNYISAYSYRGLGTSYISDSNLHVNIWSEFIGNFGFLGYILGFVFVLWVIRISERSKNIYINLFGASLIFLYFVFGFEKVCQIIWLLWLMFLFREKWVLNQRKKSLNI